MALRAMSSTLSRILVLCALLVLCYATSSLEGTSPLAFFASTILQNVSSLLTPLSLLLVWVDAHVAPGSNEDGSLLAPFSTMEKALKKINSLPSAPYGNIINLSPNATYAWGNTPMQRATLIRRCSECPRMTNMGDVSKSSSGTPVTGRIPELSLIYEDPNADESYLRYLDRLQSLTMEEMPLVQYCSGNTILTGCGFSHASAGLQNVIIQGIYCQEDEMEEEALQSDQGEGEEEENEGGERGEKRRGERGEKWKAQSMKKEAFVLSCFIEFILEEVVMWQTETIRPIFSVYAEANLTIFNSSFLGNTMTRSGVSPIRASSIVSLNNQGGLRTENALFFNNTQQSEENAFDVVLLGGVVQANGLFSARQTSFVNNSLIQHVLHCGEPLRGKAGNAGFKKLENPPGSEALTKTPQPVVGGALAIIGGTADLSHTWFINNRVQRCVNASIPSFLAYRVSNMPSGGALYIASYSWVNISYTTFWRNFAEVGGAIAIGDFLQNTGSLPSAHVDFLSLNWVKFNFNYARLSSADIYVFVNLGAVVRGSNCEFLNFASSLSVSGLIDGPGSDDNDNEVDKDTLRTYLKDQLSTDTFCGYVLTPNPNKHPLSVVSPPTTPSDNETLYEDYEEEYYDYSDRENSSSTEINDPGKIETPCAFISEIPIASSVSFKSNLEGSLNSLVRFEHTVWARPDLSKSLNSPKITPIFSPIISAQQIALFASFSARIHEIVSLNSPAIKLSHIMSSRLVDHTINTFAFYSMDSTSLIVARYGGILSMIDPNVSPLARKSPSGSMENAKFGEKSKSYSFAEGSLDHDTNRGDIDRGTINHSEKLNRFVKESEEDFENILKKETNFYQYEEQRRMKVESSIGYITNRESKNGTLEKKKRYYEAEGEEEKKSFEKWSKSDSKGSSRSSSSSINGEKDDSDPSPGSFCAAPMPEPRPAGSGDPSPDLTIYGLIVNNTMQLSSILSVTYMKSVRVIQVDWTMKSSAAGVTSNGRQKPDSVAHFSDISGYVLMDRMSLKHCNYPITVSRSNAVELGNAFFSRDWQTTPIPTIKSKSKSALVIKDSTSAYVHGVMIAGYRTAGRLSPVMIEQIREAVYLQDLLVMHNSGAQNGGALTLLYRTTSDARYTSVVDSATFISNEAATGGAIYSLGTLLIYNSTFIGNTAINAGALASFGSVGCLFKSTFHSNNAMNQGGAVASQTDLTAIYGSSFYNNWAFYAGGGIAIGRGTFTIDSSSFFKNSAPDGGAISTIQYFSPVITTPPESSKRDSHMSRFKDDIFKSSTSDKFNLKFNPDLLNFNDDFIKFNEDFKKSRPSSSKGVSGRKVHMNIFRSSFSKNSATSTGDRLPSWTTMPWPTAFSSQKSERGGAIYSCDLTHLHIVSSNFSENFARTGGAVYIHGVAPSFSAFTSNFSSNTASYAGGSIALFVPIDTDTQPTNLEFDVTSLDGDKKKRAKIRRSSKPEKTYEIKECEFTDNSAVFGASLWLTPIEGQNFNISENSWTRNIAHWGAVLYFSGHEKAFPSVTSSNMTSNIAIYVGPSLFFNGPPVTNTSLLHSFCHQENDCYQSDGTSGSKWGDPNPMPGIPNAIPGATSGYVPRFVLYYGRKANNRTFAAMPFNEVETPNLRQKQGRMRDQLSELKKSARMNIMNSLDDAMQFAIHKRMLKEEKEGDANSLKGDRRDAKNSEQVSLLVGSNCAKVDYDEPFKCTSTRREGKEECNRPDTLETTPGNISISIDFYDALEQIVDDENTYSTCLRLVQNDEGGVHLIYKPGTISASANTISFVLTVPASLVRTEETLYVEGGSRYSINVTLVVAVENVSVGSAALSAQEPNRFALVPLMIVPIHLSGCAAGYGLQLEASNPRFAACEPCPEGSYNFDGDGHCWLCADPNLPYSLVSCAQQFVRPVKGVYVARSKRNNSFSTFICPYGYCTNCTSEAAAFDMGAIHKFFHPNNAPSTFSYLEKSGVEKEFAIRALLNFFGLDNQHTKDGDTHAKSFFSGINARGNHDWQIEELEEKLKSSEISSLSNGISPIPKKTFERWDVGYDSPSEASQRSGRCPFGDCQIGRNPDSPLCGECAPGYYESFVFEECSEKLCEKPVVSAMVFVGVVFVFSAVLLHTVFFYYPAKASTSLFFLQVLPLLRVNIWSLALAPKKIREWICLDRVHSPLQRILFIQLIPLYFAVTLIVLFGIHRFGVLLWVLIKRLMGRGNRAKSFSQEKQKLIRSSRSEKRRLGHGHKINTDSSDEDDQNQGLLDHESDNEALGFKERHSSSSSSHASEGAESNSSISSFASSTYREYLRNIPVPSPETRYISEWDQRENEPFFATSRLIRSLIALSTLCIIPSMRLFSDLFHCVRVPGHANSFWFVAPSVKCESAAFVAFKSAAIPITILIIITLLALYAWTIATYKKIFIEGGFRAPVPLGCSHATTLRTMRSLAWFYDMFRSTRYYWYGPHVAERILFPIMISLSWRSPGGMQFGASLTLLIASMIQAFTWSYQDPWDNLASCIALAALTLVSLLGDSAFQGNVIDYAGRKPTLIILSFWITLNLAYVIIEVSRHVQRFMEWRRDAKEREQS